MKFKVGDKVKMVGYKYSVQSKKSRYGEVGTIKTIRNNVAYPYLIDCNGKDSGFGWCDAELEPVVNTQKIVITTDGKITTAKLYENGKVVKTAEAKCCPEDTFDFNTGAEIAMNRLIGKPVGSVKEHKYNVGDRIFAEDNIGWYPGGAWGTVVEVLNKRFHSEDYLVKFDDGGNLCSHVVPVPTKPKYYNGKVVCVKSGYPWWTVGKVYEVVDGRIKADDGDCYPKCGHKGYFDAEDVRHAGCDDAHDNKHNFKNEFIPFVEN